MSSSKLVRYFMSVALLVTLLLSLVSGPLAVASTRINDVTFNPVLSQDAAPNTLDIVCSFPTFEGNSGDAFDFEVNLTWGGPTSKNFNLEVQEDLPKWQAQVLGGYPQKSITSIGLQANSPQTITVHLVPLTSEQPDPGVYKATLVATSTTGDVKQSIELTAKVIAKYLFAFYSNSGLLNTEATAGQANHFPLRVQSTSSAPVTHITFIAAQPTGWSVKYEPADIAQLDPGFARDIDVIITPPREVVPGDYMLTLTCNAKETGNRNIELRVTVLTPTVWGWVGVVIVLLVIAGLIFMFRQLGRR